MEKILTLNIEKLNKTDSKLLRQGILVHETSEDYFLVKIEDFTHKDLDYAFSEAGGYSKNYLEILHSSLDQGYTWIKILLV